MIDEYYTWIIFGYHSYDLKPYSNKPIVARCDECCQYRTPPKAGYSDFCRACCQKGERNHFFGKHHTEETRCEMTESANSRLPHSDETRKKMVDKWKNRPPHSEEHCQHISAGVQGIPYEEWDGFVSDGEYCHKFDDECKEYIRKKYGHRCFVCNTTQEENIERYNSKLSVHHTDLNKDAGCDDHEWKLVPLCKSCHGSSHTDPLKSRIEYLRADEECAHV